jgi:hypothetical protein
MAQGLSLLVVGSDLDSGTSYMSAGIPTVLVSSSPKMCGNDDAQLVAPVLLSVVILRVWKVTRRTLNAAKVNPPDIGALVESKDGASLVECDVL